MENKVILLNGGRDYTVEPLASADAYLTRLLGSESSRRAMFFLESTESAGGDLRVAVFVGGQHVGHLAADIDKGLVATVKACEVHGVVARARGSLSVSPQHPGKVIMRVDLADPDSLLTSAELPATPAEPQTQSAKEPKEQAPEPPAQPVEEPPAQPVEEPQAQAPEPVVHYLEELQALPVEELQALPVEELQPHAPEEVQMPAALPFPQPPKPETTATQETTEVPASIAVPGTGSKAASALSASYEDAAALMDLEDVEETDSSPEGDSVVLDGSVGNGSSGDATADFIDWPPPKPRPVNPIVPAAPTAAPVSPVTPAVPTPAPAPVAPPAPAVASEPIMPAVPVVSEPTIPAAPVASAPVAPESTELPQPVTPTTPVVPLEPTAPIQAAAPQAPVPVPPVEPRPAEPPLPTSEGAPQAPEQDHDWYKSFSNKRSSWMDGSSGQSETPQPGWLGFKASQKAKSDATNEGADKPDDSQGNKT